MVDFGHGETMSMTSEDRDRGLDTGGSGGGLWHSLLESFSQDLALAKYLRYLQTMFAAIVLCLFLLVVNTGLVVLVAVRLHRGTVRTQRTAG